MNTLTQEDIENMSVELADKIGRRTITRQLTIRAERQSFPLFNISTRLVGGIRFLKIGRFCFSFCVTRTYRSF